MISTGKNSQVESKSGLTASDMAIANAYIICTKVSVMKEQLVFQKSVIALLAT